MKTLAVQSSRFFIALLLFGLVMTGIGFLLFSDPENDSVSVSEPALKNDNGSDSTVDGTEDTADADDAGEDKPPPYAQSMIDAVSAEPPPALLAGKFAEDAPAQALLNRLQSDDYRTQVVKTADEKDVVWYLVLLDNFENQANMDQTKYRLQQEFGIAVRPAEVPAAEDEE